jgi:hypothetical protein
MKATALRLREIHVLDEMDSSEVAITIHSGSITKSSYWKAMTLLGRWLNHAGAIRLSRA